VGSSQIRKRGRVASARAMEMRWRWPPENSCGYFFRRRAPSPTCSSRSSTMPRTWARVGELVEADRLGDDVAHLHARVDRGIRVLEDHLHLAAVAVQLAPRADAR
jgi:hypothetical protein